MIDKKIVAKNRKAGRMSRLSVKLKGHIIFWLLKENKVI